MSPRPESSAAPDIGASAALTSLARGGALGVAGSLGGTVLSLALIVVVTRTAGRTSAGALFASTSLFLIVVAVAELGTDTGLVHTVPRLLAGSRPADARRCLVIAILPVIVASVACAVLLFVGAARLAAVTSGGVEVGALRALALFVPVAALCDVVLAATRAYGTIRDTVTVDRLGRPAGQLALVALAGVAGTAVTGLTLAWVVPYLPGLAAAALLLRRRLRRRATPASAPAPRDRSLARRFWRYTAPRGIARVCQVALQRLDIVLVAALRSPADAAIYTAATRFMAVGQLAPLAMQQVMQPLLSRLLAKGDRAAATAVLKSSTTWSVALSWPLYLLTACFAPLVLRVFGSTYGDGVTVTVILALTMLLATAAGPVDVVLTMAGHSVASLMTMLLGLAVDVALDLALIPGYGIVGAAVAWSCAIVVRNAVAVALIARWYGMSALSRPLGRTAGVALATFGGMALAVRVALGTSLTAGSVALVVSTTAYVAVLVAYRAGKRPGPGIGDRSPLLSIAGDLRLAFPTQEGHRDRDRLWQPR